MVWVALFYLSFRVRRRIARLSDKDLNDLLTHVVLKGGVLITMAQLAFLVFSSVQCESEMNYAAGGTFKNCNRTLYAQTGIGLASVKSELRKELNLSIEQIATLTGISLRRKIQGLLTAVPKKVQKETSWEYANIASLNLGGWQRVQAGFMTVTGFCSLYLLTALGTTGDENNWVGIAGAAGLVAAALTTLIGMYTVTSTNERLQQLTAIGGSEKSDTTMEGRNVSVGDVQEGFYVGHFM
ncbi:hypothetical protein TrVE_jg3991 [Triparma verrucosa]|nr:hypothetical protein TrVE_jg3991 [Triparma verrucosa]